MLSEREARRGNLGTPSHGTSSRDNGVRCEYRRAALLFVTSWFATPHKRNPRTPFPVCLRKEDKGSSFLFQLFLLPKWKNVAERLARCIRNRRFPLPVRNPRKLLPTARSLYFVFI